MTAGIAHEIKNPLNFVNNFASLSNDLVDSRRDSLSALSPARCMCGQEQTFPSAKS